MFARTARSMSRCSSYVRTSRLVLPLMVCFPFLFSEVLGEVVNSPARSPLYINSETLSYKGHTPICFQNPFLYVY